MIESVHPYPTYKDSRVPWLGMVPKHWDVLPARAAYRPKRTRNVGMSRSAVLSLSFGRIVVKPDEKQHGLVPESFESYQLVDPGDIIVRTTDLQNDQKSLRIGFSDHRGIITSAYMCLRTTDRVSAKFGYELLNAYDLLKIIYGFGSGLRQSLDFGDIKQMPVPVPPPDEQAAIVRFLDVADRRIRRYIAAKSRLIALLDEQKQAIIQRTVTRGLGTDVTFKPSGVGWLGDVPAHWQVLSLKRVARVQGGYAFRSDDFVDEGVPVVRMSNLKGGAVDFTGVARIDAGRCLPGYALRAGDLLYGMSGSIGNFGLIGEDQTPSQLNQRVGRFLPVDGRITTEYLSLLVQVHEFSGQISSFSTGTAQLNVSPLDIERVWIAVPDREEQVSIASRLRTDLAPQTRATAIARREIELVREYRTHVIADVVSGRLDVRELAARLPAEAEAPEPREEADISDEGDESREDASQLERL